MPPAGRSGRSHPARDGEDLRDVGLAGAARRQLSGARQSWRMSRPAHARTTDVTTGNRGARNSRAVGFRGAEPPLQELPGIIVVSARRPLFIPVFEDAARHAGSTRSSSCRALRVMARPGLEPGTPRFSVVASTSLTGPKSLVTASSQAGRQSSEYPLFAILCAAIGTEVDFGTQCRQASASNPDKLCGVARPQHVGDPAGCCEHRRQDRPRPPAHELPI